MSRPASANGGREFELTDAQFERVRELIYRRAGIALTPAKRDMVYSRLVRRLRMLRLDGFEAYLKRLVRDDAGEWQAFVNALTTNLTAFFREPHHFQVLAEHLRAGAADRQWRIWCAAASTGEEPYSIAMTAAEALGRSAGRVSIVATDIDTEVLAHAERAVYDAARVEGLDRARLGAFFLRGVGPNEGRVRVRPELARRVEFRPLNLTAPSWHLQGPFDVVFCRNVMIYFDKPTQRRILHRMHELLTPDGLLFAGHSESFLNAPELFQPRGGTVYARTRTSGNGRAA